MASVNQASGAAAPHRNQQLFSDYYLNRNLPGRADWQGLAAEAEPGMARLASLLAGYTPSANEAQVEKDWVRPVLEALGHTFEVQPALKTPDGTKRPDYVFYRDAARLVAQKGKTLTDALPAQGGFAVGDAKSWDRPLDMAVKAKGKESDTFSNKNPSYQIAFYIQHSGVDWGILTNGRLWRLYHKDTAHKLDRFYEVDLPALLETGDVGQFLYFFAFFRRAAFDAGPLGVAEILRASEEYARGVGDSLKRQVYEALRHLSQGFLDYTPNGLTPDAATLKRVYDSALILLYRLLFILYAESRELLPVRASDAYRHSYGLCAIKQEIAQGRPLLAGSATLWPRLKTLFGFIDKGEPPLKVATFNGGLFDPRRHDFLERHTVGDAHLQAAIDRLARIGTEFVDYRDLSVRHLGTIYEGLLEYHLQEAAPAAPPGGVGADGAGWTVDLLNDKGERKATGSYYTPDYIVKYIVEQAVGPMLREAVSGRGRDAAKVEAVLGVNVLDPAMGSGHFLVEATEYIARFLVEEAITPGADAGGAEADLLYWKRRVAQSCIYGVDLNPLAVELAKLSLWLTTVAQDRPLSFLDHHLRVGNALVGARLSDLQLGGKPKAKKSPKAAAQGSAGQLSMMADDTFRQSMMGAVGSMWLIEESEAQTVADVKKQEELYTSLHATFTHKWGRLADLVTATHFGVAIDHFLWKPLAAYAKGETVAGVPKFVEWLEASEAIARERHFFHWELEFPEVFFDRFGKPLGDKAGFDAVIGNPPYNNMQKEEPLLRSYVEHRFPEYFRGKADIYYYFMALAGERTRIGCHWSFITARYYIESFYSDNLWSQLLQNNDLSRIIDFGNFQVFQDPSVDTAILLATRTPEGVQRRPTSISTVLANNISEDEITSLLFTDQYQHLDPSHVVTRSVEAKSIRAIPNVKLQLNDLCFVGKGAASGNDDVFVVDQTTVDQYKLEPELLHLIAEDNLINRYECATANRWFITTQRGIDIHLYPNTQRYLATKRTDLEKRYAVKHEGVEWYEVVRYNTDVFDRTSPQIYAYYRSQKGKFAYSTINLCTLTTTFVIVTKPGVLYSNLFLLSVLNSEYVRKYFAASGKVMGGVVEYSSTKLNNLPIPMISFTTNANKRALQAEQAILLYEQNNYQALMGFVNSILVDESRQGDVVHDFLTYLSQQMIAMHTERRDAIDNFLLNLEGILSEAQLQKIGRLWTPPREPQEANDKKKKAYTASMYEAVAQIGDLSEQQLELREHIGMITEVQWKWLLKKRLNKVTSLADLVKVFQKHQPRIAILDKRIEDTDTLIDQIVNALYELAPEKV